MSKIQYQQKPTSQQNDQTTNQTKTYHSKRQGNRNYQSRPRPRYQDKQNRYKNKYGFQYDESKISYNTEIPEMPSKPKQKPDQAKLNKKIEQLETKVKQLKKQRKEKKLSYKNGNKQFTEQIQEQKRNINLAKACLVVLNFDKVNHEKDILDVENKIAQHRKKIDFLSKPSQKTVKNQKIDEMNYAELVREQERITQEMSTRVLTKAEETQLSNKLNKIKKRKVQVPQAKVQSTEDNAKLDEIQNHKRSIQKLRNVRQTLADKMTDIDNKIESIEDNIQDFEEAIEQIHQKLRVTDNSKLLEEAAVLKQQILDIWDEIAQLQEQHKKKLFEFEQEQEKIKYIQWAKDVKAKKAEAWELEKQERKKQKLREKEKQKKTDQKTTKQGEKKQGETTEQKPQFQRKKFNRNQKEIDACAFLIQYCKDLSSASGKTEDKSGLQKQFKLEEELKKGEWAKMKNVEVIQSKKKRGEEETEQKASKKRQSKTPAQQQPSDRFSHTYFVAQVFDSVKVLPPTKAQDLEKLINELQDKMEYFITHPDEQVGKSLLPIRESERQTKGKGGRRIINTEEFPSLN